MADDSNLSVKELKDELRKFAGANLGGNKAQLQSRLKEYRQVAAQAAEFALTSAGVGEDGASSAGIITPASRTGGRSSPVRDTTAPLRQGEALESVLFRRPAKLHPITIRCLTALKASSFLLKPLDAPDPRLEAQLYPLLVLCKTIDRRSGEIDLVSSYATNVGRLTSVVQSEFKHIASTVITVELEACVKQVINVLTGGIMFEDLPKPSAAQGTFRSVAGEEGCGEEDHELQKAIEESMLEEQQRVMQEYYESESRAAGVAASRMKGVEQGAEAPTYQLPTDNDVRQAVAVAGPAGIDFLDLIKVVNVRDLGVEAVEIFRRGILERGVVQQSPSGGLVLSSGPPRTDIVATAPTLLPTPTRLTPKPTSSVAPSSIPGLEHEVARIRDGVLLFFRAWAEDFPEPSEGDWPSDFDTKEKNKIRKYVTAKLQESEVVKGEDADGTKTEDVVKKLLTDTQFPVTKAKNESAIRAVVKELLYKFRRSSGAKSVDGGDDGAEKAGEEGATATTTTAPLGPGAGEKRGRDEDDDDDAEGAEAGHSPRKKR